MPSGMRAELPKPWRTFLEDVDRRLPRSVDVHCLGGFVAALYYDLPRPTNDLDYIEVVPAEAMVTLQDGLHFQHVGGRACRNRTPNASPRSDSARS